MFQPRRFATVKGNGDLGYRHQHPMLELNAVDREVRHKPVCHGREATASR
jgi:hypothetical protein